MKAKDRRKLERKADEMQKEGGLTFQNIRKLIATDPIMQRAVLDAAKQARPPQREGETN